MLRDSAIYLLIAVFLISGVFLIKTYPPIHLGVHLNAGDEFIMVDEAKGSDESPIKPRLYFAFLNGFMKMLRAEGIDEIFAGRALSLLLASLSLYLLYLIGILVSDKKTGFISSLFLLVAFPFFWQSRIARPEMLSIVFILWSFCLIIYSKQTENKRFIFYGAFISTLSVLIHPNNLQHIIALFVVFLFLYRFKPAQTAIYILGLLIGFLIWFLISYLPSKGIQITTAIGEVPRVYNFPIFEKTIFSLLKESIMRFPRDYFLDYFSLYKFYYHTLINPYYFAILALISTICGLFSSKKGIISALLVFLVASVFANYLFAQRLGYWHAVEYIPFVCLCMALGITSIFERFNLKRFLPLAVLLVILPSLFDISQSVLRFRGYSYERLIGRISSNLPKGSRVLGLPIFRYAFNEKDFQEVWFDIERPYKNCPDFKGEIIRRNIEYILVDDGFDKYSLSCGDRYREDIRRYLFTETKVIGVLDGYPDSWGSEKTLSGVVIFKR